MLGIAYESLDAIRKQLRFRKTTLTGTNAEFIYVGPPFGLRPNAEAAVSFANSVRLAPENADAQSLGESSTELSRRLNPSRRYGKRLR